MAVSDAQPLAKPRNDGDSSGTDPEMPPLIPVSPRPVAEPKRRVLKPTLQAALQLRNRARGRGRGRGRGAQAKALPKQRLRIPLKDLQPPVLAAPGVSGGPQTAEFGKRAGDLAAALDKLAPPAPAAGEAPEPELPRKRPRRYCLEGALEEIEVSKEARAKAAASLGEEFVDSEASESDDDDENDDDDEEAAPKKKRKGGSLLSMLSSLALRVFTSSSVVARS